MALPFWIDNLIAYSLQMAILASAGTLLAYLFRLRLPRVSHIYWQALLLACLCIPALQNWKHPSIGTSAVAMPGTAVYTIPRAAVAVQPKPSISVAPEAIAVVLGAGLCLRLAWLAIGFFRLRLFLRNSQSLSGEFAVPKSLLSCVRVRARFFLSNEIDSPATFGIFSPKIILPRSFSEMSEACREAVVCHELLHVRRRDWAVILIEEIIRSVYWFHPAVWWLLSRIHLSREQSVDHEVVQLTGNRQPYLDSLLEIARARGRPKAVPAPLFLKERHLVQRVSLLIKEVSMNRLRLTISLAGIALLLAGTVRLASGWFPLTGTPAVNQEGALQPLRAPIRVGGNVQMSKLIVKVEPVYPERAKAARIRGNVTLLVTVNERGEVSDIQVSSGHPFLTEEAISAVKQWRYSPTLLNGMPVPVTTTVTIGFEEGSVKLGAPVDFQGNLPLGTSPSAILMGSGTLHILQNDGLGGTILFRTAPIDDKGQSYSNAPIQERFRAPELPLPKERLHMLAEAGWPAQVEKNNLIAYAFVINEVSEIKNLTRISGPNIPEVEKELAQMRAVTPGILGSTPVSSWCIVEIRLQSSAPAK
jgi:TonB family protein